MSKAAAKRASRRAQRDEKLSPDPRPIANEPKFQKPNHHIQPKTENQDRLIHAINESEIVVASGPAGVGKTYIVGSCAAKFLSQNDVERIVLTRANVGVGKSLGLLPGSVEDKMTPLLMPILEVLRQRMGDSIYTYSMGKRRVEMQPIEYVRGRSFKNTFLIIDEAQNLTKEEVVALVTRFESGRIVFLGDPFQNDLKGETGIEWLVKFAKRNGLDYPCIEFSLDDVVRSDLVKQFLTAMYKETGKLDKKQQQAVLLG